LDDEHAVASDRFDARFAAMWLPLAVIPGRDGGRNSSSASDIEWSSSRDAPTPP
jgi:hypothetical protein